MKLTKLRGPDELWTLLKSRDNLINDKVRKTGNRKTSWKTVQIIYIFDNCNNKYTWNLSLVAAPADPTMLGLLLLFLHCPRFSSYFIIFIKIIIITIIISIIIIIIIIISIIIMIIIILALLKVLLHLQEDPRPQAQVLEEVNGNTWR